MNRVTLVICAFAISPIFSAPIPTYKLLDIGATAAGGVAGVIGAKVAGALIGGAIGGPLGMLFVVYGGTVFGYMCGFKTARCISEWIFGLPKQEALAKAYEFLELSSSASNSDINSRYRYLALKYHPDKGGDRDMWTKLQYCVAVIREARGES